MCGNVNEKSSDDIGASKLEGSTTLGWFVITCVGYTALAVAGLGRVGVHIVIICVNTLNVASRTCLLPSLLAAVDLM